MSFMWIIIIAWLAVQIPLAMLIGKCIQFGTDDAPNISDPARRRSACRPGGYAKESQRSALVVDLAAAARAKASKAETQVAAEVGAEQRGLGRRQHDPVM